ncbi:B3/B4 domain-containing protein [Actinacidiphila bryophytorum]|uniref:B3_4 domain-containing protein n=1 Tax=Actinacidiphila bryophytorum TaxID=1436133 RepID=A0A9W4ED07_9ACTN|nr:phenylalanine--tRNA ligase beta subunit-related protein [Actinacidiphila bryophytorum]MBM9438491.1 hypothetical protein [Actinacidiphila bryophytorum]MBN6542897.1 hypothetical protein [Actinacidiphila bryophytorum]CAG7613080.1 B3_4 domain-containing protein [Actinacidiphila bryophytorum]
MKLKVSDDLRKAFPELRIAVLQASGIDNTGIAPDLDRLKNEAADRMYQDFTYETLNELPEIGAWRDAYRAFGVKPKDSRPTAEAFLRRLVKGEEFPTISKAVDSYLLVETKFYLPVGGYDASTVTGDITLRFSEGGESFTPIGGRTEEFTKPGEVVYCDDARILTRRWNYRDCDACKVTDASTDIVLFTEAPFAGVPTESLQASVELMAEYIGTFCGGSVSTLMLDYTTAGEYDL